MKSENKHMNRGLQLLVILCIVALITSIISRSITAWLRIEMMPSGYWMAGSGRGTATVFLGGSSLAGDGISWGVIANLLGAKIEGWGVAGSSPCEWEFFQHRAIQPKMTVFVVSPYDLNEYFLSDFRADIVPLKQTVMDLRESHADWSFCKRVLGMYPLNYIRIFFPSAGRSFGIMGGLREKLESLLRPMDPKESEAGPTLSFDETASAPNYKKGKVSNWSPAEMLRRLVGIRSACQGRHAFNGPKKLAFLRMLHKAQEQGGVIVVVLPVSPAYSGEFLTPEVRQEFEDMLTNAQKSIPQSQLIRIDQLNELNSNEYFWDLVHMNLSGKKIATEALLRRLSELGGLP